MKAVEHGLPPVLPTPGLDGTYRDSCVVCLRGTDTGLALSGEAEWVIAGLITLGIPQEQAEVMLSQSTGCDPGMVPADDCTMLVRVCGECASAPGVGIHVGLVSSGELPHYGQPKGRAS